MRYLHKQYQKKSNACAGIQSNQSNYNQMFFTSVLLTVEKYAVLLNNQIIPGIRNIGGA